MPSFLQPLIDGLVPGSVVALIWVAARWGLIAFLSCVGVFDRGARGKNARAVLTLLLRRRPTQDRSIDN